MAAQFLRIVNGEWQTWDVLAGVFNVDQVVVGVLDNANPPVRPSTSGPSGPLDPAPFINQTTFDFEPMISDITVSDASVQEGDSGVKHASFTIALDAPAASPITVTYMTVDGTAVVDSDYNSATGSVTFLPGQTEKEVLVDVIGDTAYEHTEAFSLDISTLDLNATISDASGVATIVDNDPIPTVTVGNRINNELNCGTHNASYLLTKSGATGVNATVHFATESASAISGSDFVGTSGDVTFLPDETTKFVSVPIKGDVVYERSESYRVRLSARVDVQTGIYGVGVILNDDAPPQLTINDVHQAEGNTRTDITCNFTVTLTGSTSLTATVDYRTEDGSAKTPGDYTAKSGTLTFTPGQHTKVIRVPVRSDTVHEATESFSVRLRHADRTTSPRPSGRCTIFDNDN